MPQERTGAAPPVVAARRAERAALAETVTSTHIPLVPRGLVHAAVLGAVVTECGVGLDELNLFPGLAFVAAGFLVRCEDCIGRMAPDGGSSGLRTSGPSSAG